MGLEHHAGRLQGKAAVITGADSGIGWTVAALHAREDASYMSGQVLHPNGGTVVNG